jgi:hypothetical protein
MGVRAVGQGVLPFGACERAACDVARCLGPTAAKRLCVPTVPDRMRASCRSSAGGATDPATACMNRGRQRGATAFRKSERGGRAVSDARKGRREGALAETTALRRNQQSPVGGSRRDALLPRRAGGVSDTHPASRRDVRFPMSAVAPASDGGTAGGGPAVGQSWSPAVADIIGARRACTVAMISSVSMPCR